MQTENSIPEFEVNKEYPIGGFFKIGKEVFKVVKSREELCPACDVATTAQECAHQRCTASEREDRVDVCFILYDELES